MTARVSESPVWREEAAPPALPPLEETRRAQVCVVGLGAAGLTCVGELRRLGLSVAGLDAGVPGDGASGRNGGFLLAGLPPFYHDAVGRFGRERARALYRLTLDELARTREATPACVRFNGSLRIAADAAERDDCRAQLAAMRADGLPAEWYEGVEGEGLLIPTDGLVHPTARCRELAGQALEHGAGLFRDSPAVRIRPGEVETPRGRVRCEHVVVAVDGGLEDVFPELAGRVRTARLQALATAPAPAVDWPRPVYARHGIDYWQQLPDGRVVLGGRRDADGAAEWTDRAVPTPGVQARLDALLSRLRVHAPVTHRWAGTSAYTADGLPLFETVRPGVRVIGAYGGTGNVLGPLLGRCAAREAAGHDTELAGLLRREA